MKDDKKKQKNHAKSESTTCCYRVIDACGCVVGSYCCDGPDMTNCRLESC